MKRLPSVALLILLVLVQVCLAAIAVDTSGINTSGTNQATQTVSLTVASNSNKLILGGHGIAATEDPTSFTFNGDALTQNAGSEIQTGISSSAGIWYRLEPDVATGNLVVTYGTGFNAGVCGLVLYNVDQMSPLRDSDETSTGGGSGTSLNLTLTTVAGDYVFYVIHVYEGSGGDPGALDHTAGSATGETEVGEVEPINDQSHFSCAYAVAAGSTTQVGYSWTNASRAALVAVSVTPAATASTPSSFIQLQR